MSTYSFGPQMIYKMKNGKLLLISADPDQNVLFEFEGPVAKILEELMQKGQPFTLEQMTLKAAGFGAGTEDVESVLNFCLENEIITKA